MNIDLIKTSDSEGAVYVKYQPTMRPPGPEYSVTLPFLVKDDDMIEFKITQECLNDLINLIKRNYLK